jgi:hypothetical protein
MKKKVLRSASIIMICMTMLGPMPARADFWGGDLPLLASILAQAIEQLAQLKSILGSGVDTLNYIQDINRGIRDAMSIIRTQNSTISPGVLSQLDTVELLMGEVEHLYGKVPNTAEAPMQRTTDQSVAEAIHTHNEAFKYAQTVDPEAERIKEYARFVSPLGAERLTAQSLGVVINVLNQILRVDSAMLKLQSENLALQNRHEKVGSQHFKMQYEGLSRAFGELKPTYSLPSLSTSGR